MATDTTFASLFSTHRNTALLVQHSEEQISTTTTTITTTLTTALLHPAVGTAMIQSLYPGLGDVAGSSKPTRPGYKFFIVAEK